MAISIETARVVKAGNDTTGPFTVADGANNIYVNAASELVVTHVGSDGAETTWTNPTHYSTTGTFPGDGISITTVTAVASGESLVIERDTPLTQTVSGNVGSDFSSSTYLGALDKITRALQDLQAKVDRMAQLNPADTDGSGGYDFNNNNLLTGGFAELGEQSAPSTPASGYLRLYADTSGDVHAINDGGTDTNLTDAASTASSSATAAAASAAAAAASASYSTTPALVYNYDSGTTSGCASGEVRFDSGIFASITEFYIHETSSIQGGYGAYLNIWDDSTSTAKGWIKVYNPQDPDVWVILQVDSAQTDNGDDRTFPVTYIDSSGSMFSDATEVHVHFDRNGDGGGISSVQDDTSPQAGGDFDMNAHMMQFSKGSDIASGATLTIPTDGNAFDVTGTTTITAFSNVAVGTWIILQFDGALTLTHHATDLILPRSANIATAAGDKGIFWQYATGDWMLISWLPAADYQPYDADTAKLDTAQAWTAHQYTAVDTLTDGANITWTVSSEQKAKVTLAGNRTMNAVTGAVEGATYLLWIIQDGTGSRTITWTTSGAGSFDFGDDGEPTLTTTASEADCLAFEAMDVSGTLKLRFMGIKKGFS